MKLIAISLALLVLSACSSGSNSPNSSAEPQASEKPDIRWLSILIPEAAAEGDLSGYSVEVQLTGSGTPRKMTADSTGTASFANVPPGDYLIAVTVRSGATEVARATKSTTVGSTEKTETISVQLPAPALSVGVKYEISPPALSGEYRGQGRTTPYCFENDFLSGFGLATTTTTLSMSGGNISIKADIFSGLIIEFTGTYTDDAGRIEAMGTYRSSDFKTGTWTLQSIAEPAEGTLFLSIRTDGDCETVVDVVGLKM